MDNRDDIEPIDRLASEITDKVRRGEQLSSSELQARYPELDDDMQGWVHTLSILEEASFRHRTKRPGGAVVNRAGQQQKMLGGFRIIREISRGGMGIVYEAQQQSLNRRVAVKVLPPSPMLSHVARARFEREGNAVARLHHSNIVPVFGTGVERGVQYCVMQYIDGCSLDRIIADLRSRAGVAPSITADDADSADADVQTTSELIEALINRDLGDSWFVDAADEGQGEQASRSPRPIRLGGRYFRNVARIAADVADALSHAHHQGVLHRDIKPANLLLDRECQIWVTDFGLAKLHDEENLTGTGKLIGTLRYTPPEQFQGQADARSDVYSLGLTLYELCTLEYAFAGSDQPALMRQIINDSPKRPRSLRADIPLDLETIILKAISPEPAGRYQSAADFASDLRSFIDDLPVAARRQTVWESGYRWCRRHRLETALGGFALLMLLLFAISASVAYVRESRLRHELEENLATTHSALERVYDSYLPDWTTSSTVSAHGLVSVSPGSAKLMEELVEVYEEISNRKGQGTQAVLESASAMRRVGLIYHRLGEFERSKKSYNDAKKRLSGPSSDNPDYHRQLEYARVCNELGAVHWTERHFGEAHRCHESALHLLNSIPRDFHDRAAVTFELARTLYLFGRRGREINQSVATNHAREIGDPRDRLSPSLNRVEFVARATQILEDLTDQDPGNKDYHHLLALCYREYADRLLGDEGRPTDENMAKAIKALEVLVIAEPEHPGYQYSLCTTLQWISLGDQPTPTACNVAADALQRSMDIADHLSQLRPDEWIYAAAKVEAAIKLANVLQRGNRLAEGLELSQLAIRSATQLAEKYPQADLFRFWVALAHRRHGDLLWDDGHPQQALDAYDLATKQLKRLLESDSTLEVSVLTALQTTISQRASVLRRLDQDDRAGASEREAESIQQRLDLALQRLASS